MLSEAQQFRVVQLKQLVQLLFQELQAFGVFAAAGEADKAQNIFLLQENSIGQSFKNWL